jgi:hypothetical protein
MCYLPHNAFVFYDAAGKPVAFYEICFSCLRHRSDLNGVESGNADFPALAAIFSAHRLPFGGFTDVKEFTRNFESFLKRNDSPATDK